VSLRPPQLINSRDNEARIAEQFHEAKLARQMQRAHVPPSRSKGIAASRIRRLRTLTICSSNVLNASGEKPTERANSIWNGQITPMSRLR
jgi:hypothetical protein